MNSSTIVYIYFHGTSSILAENIGTSDPDLYIQFIVACWLAAAVIYIIIVIINTAYLIKYVFVPKKIKDRNNKIL